MSNTDARSSLMAFATPVSVESVDSAYRGNRVAPSEIKRSVRLVSPVNDSISSCDAAYWPYYPTECLKRVETAGL